MVLLFYRETIGRSSGGNVGFGTYSGMMPMGRGGNVHPQLQAGAGTSVRPGSAGSAPGGASYAEPYSFVSCAQFHQLHFVN